MAIILVAACAFAATPTIGKAMRDGNRVTIQNLTKPSPNVAKSRCDRFAAKTKGVLKGYTTAGGYNSFDYTVTDDAGAALPVKRRINNGAAGLIKSSDGFTVNSDMSNVTFDAISSGAPGKNYNICIDRGGGY